MVPRLPIDELLNLDIFPPGRNFIIDRGCRIPSGILKIPLNYINFIIVAHIAQYGATYTPNEIVEMRKWVTIRENELKLEDALLGKKH